MTEGVGPAPTIHLVDASPYLFRAFFSVPRTLVDDQGRPQNAVYGFRGFLRRYLDDHRPTHIGIAFDRHFNQSFRNEFYPAYKAHREASPPELDAQVDPCVALAQSMGMATFIDERYEADDLIATIIDRTRSTGASYVIVSSDKDLTQLVCDSVTWADPARDLRFDAAAVEAKFGVRPEQIVDFLALAGDAVDNIPGVRGIGAKTAAELLRNYSSLDGIYETPAGDQTHTGREAGAGRGQRADVAAVSDGVDRCAARGHCRGLAFSRRRSSWRMTSLLSASSVSRCASDNRRARMSIAQIVPRRKPAGVISGAPA